MPHARDSYSRGCARGLAGLLRDQQLHRLACRVRPAPRDARPGRRAWRTRGDQRVRTTAQYLERLDPKPKDVFVVGANGLRGGSAQSTHRRAASGGSTRRASTARGGGGRPKSRGDARVPHAPRACRPCPTRSSFGLRPPSHSARLAGSQRALLEQCAVHRLEQGPRVSGRGAACCLVRGASWRRLGSPADARPSASGSPSRSYSRRRSAGRGGRHGPVLK